MEERITCIICNTEHPAENLHLFHGQHLCTSCFEDRTIVCQYCGQRVWDEDIHYNEGQPVCPSCFHHHFLTCDACGRAVHESEAHYLTDDDEDYPYCEECYAARQKQSIHDYYFKPEPIFCGDGSRCFGVELETDEAGESNANARALLDIANEEQELSYCKHDGSLDEGFEIVTHPMSLDFHCHQMPWEAVMAEAVQLGYRSHQANTCGLHIHVSRDAFGATETEQDSAIARILYFFEKNWEELLKFSRRTQRQLDRWAARYGYKDRPRDILDEAKKDYHGGRYTCVNLQNEDTIEFRISRGTLKYNTLIASLQLVDRVCDTALHLSDDELKALSWSAFVSGCTQPELVQYLKERRLYVNEPVETEAEL